MRGGAFFNGKEGRVDFRKIQYHHVSSVDVIPEKVQKLNNKISPIQDDYIEKYLAENPYHGDTIRCSRY